MKQTPLFLVPGTGTERFMPHRIGFRCLAGAALGGILWILGVLLVKPVNAEPREPETLPRPRPKLTWQASTSCASTACHGGNVGTAPHGCEYTFWASRDRHANAYTVLLEERSRIIERNLHGDKARPETDPLCLRCHTTQGELHEVAKGVDRKPAAQPPVTLLEGVGCDRCHSTRAGARWITEHYSREWPSMSEADRRTLGFRPLGNLVAQARLCAECHVGTRDADVDHDLIAAGHPRLNFEFGSFRANMPPHWDSRGKKVQQPDLEARTWAIGRLVSAEFALDLLAARAGKDARKPWPEFAEYDCYACHQPLRDSVRNEGKRVPGTLVWSNWYTADLDEALSAGRKIEDRKLSSGLQALRVAMGRPEPDRGAVAQQAASLAAHLRNMSAKLPGADTLTSGQAQDRLRALTARPVNDWEDAAQRYLALAALYHTGTDLDAGKADAATAAALRRLAKQLNFAPGRDAPTTFDARTFSEELQKLHRHLEAAESKP